MQWYSTAPRADASSFRTALGKKIARGNAEGARKVTDYPEGWIPLAALDTADISPMPTAFDGEVFLGPTALFAKLANASAEGDRGRRHSRMKAGIKTMFLETISIVGSRRRRRSCGASRRKLFESA